DTFSALDLVAQSGLIAEILKMTACNAGRANLEAVGGAKGTGVLKITKNLPKAGKEEFFLIHQSVTGFFEKKVDLLGDAF
ncbi:MAG: type II CRISPR RNA-guided endonuclease Cas9, partial [Clostridiales bacterium]|nr:type II CRISPR RNA-guided endonuclease Cas9 [Clostridiales bacterium]